MLPPDDPGRVSIETLAEVVRYAPLAHLSSGPDGMAIAARASATGEVVELRQANVALDRPERWRAIEELARAYELVSHRALRRLLAREVIAGTPVLVLEGVLERDLTARLALGPLPELDACTMVATLADALWSAHVLGIVHGNLGPSAVLLADSGAPLLDVPWLDVGRPQTPLDVACHPPERAHEALDMRSDVFALGVLLKLMLLGHAPAAHEPRDTFGAFVQLTREPPGENARVLLASNAQALSLENTLDREVVARIERTAPREDALTAARAACMASFRRLFPSEVLAQGRLVSVGRTAFLVTRIADQRRLMSDIGDARAFEHVLALLDVLEDVVSGEGGAVVKTASGTSLSAFSSGAQAVRAALLLRNRLTMRELEPHAGKRLLDIRIAVHEGAAVAATFDGKLDYFGQSIERAIELLDHAPARHVLISPAVLQDHNVQVDAGAFGQETRLIDTGDGFAMLVQLGRAS